MRSDGLAVAILAKPAREEEAVPQFLTLFSLLVVFLASIINDCRCPDPHTYSSCDLHNVILVAQAA
jgi:hypothetical protein